MEEYYPPVGFYFSVKFSGISNKDDNKFQEVSGMTATLETESKKIGGFRNPIQLPKKTTYTNLVLKRGFLKNSEVSQWVKEAMENLQITLRDIEVSLLDEEGKPIVSWSFVNAYPVKWQINAFQSTKSEIALETLELTYEYFRRI